MPYSIDDLKWTSARLFRAVGTGKFYTTAKGTRREIQEGKDFVETTAAGTLEYGEWRGLMEDAVEREGKGGLLNRIVESCRRHCAWLQQEEELRGYALECLSSEAYKAWDDFMEG